MFVISFFPTLALASSASSESIFPATAVVSPPVFSAMVVSSEAPPPEDPCPPLDGSVPQAAPANARMHTRTMATFAPRGFVPGFLIRPSMLKIAPFVSGSGKRIYGTEATADLAGLAVSAAINPPDGLLTSRRPAPRPQRHAAAPRRAGRRRARPRGSRRTGHHPPPSCPPPAPAPPAGARVPRPCPRTGRPRRQA